MTSTGKEEDNVDKRIRQAQKAWWSNAGVLTRRASPWKVRAVLFQSLVLSQLFFATGLLSLTAESERRFDVFINGCVRKMAWTTLTAMQVSHVTQLELNQAFGLMPANVHVAREVMKWLGKLARMSDDRVPKRMLFAYPSPDDCHGGTGKRVGAWGGTMCPRLGIIPSFSRHARARIVEIGNHFYRRSSLGSTPFECAKGLVATNKYGWRTRTVESRRNWMKYHKIKSTDNDNWGCYAMWMGVAKDVALWSRGMGCVVQYELGNTWEIQRAKITKRRRRKKAAAAVEMATVGVEPHLRKSRRKARLPPEFTGL